MKRADLEQKLYASKQIYTQTPIPTQLTERMHQTLQTHALQNQKPNRAETEQSKEKQEKTRLEKRKVIGMKQWNWKKNNRHRCRLCRIGIYRRIEYQPNFCGRYAKQCCHWWDFQSFNISQL